MLRNALDTHRLYCVAMQRPEAEAETPAQVAGVGVIRAAVENPDGTSNIILQGLARVSLGRVLRKRPYRVHSLQAMESVAPDPTRLDALAIQVREIVGERFRQGLPSALKLLEEMGSKGGEPASNPAADLLRSLVEIRDPGMLADLVSCTLLPDPRQRQVMLETVDLEQRLRYLIAFLLRDGAGDGPGG